jgi:hypothetical protein
MVRVEDLKLVREAVFLTYLMDIVKNKSQPIEFMQSPLKPLYDAVTELLMQRIHTDLMAAKKRLKAAGVRYVDGEGDWFKVSFKVFARGHQTDFDIVREVVKAELSVMLGKYIGELGRELKINIEKKHIQF